MRGIAAVLLLVGACGTGEHGAYITVKVADPSVGTVALYIGNDDCSIATAGSSVPCQSLVPENEQNPLRVGQNGGAYFRDTDVTFTSKVSGGVAQFHLESTKQAQTVEIVAVGFAGDPAAADARMVKVLSGVTIPNVDVVQIQTTLDPASPVMKNEDPKIAQPDGNYVLIWTSPSAPSECVLVESWSSGKATRTYVVPSADADCDGLPTLDASGTARNPLECDPLWFDRPTPIGSGKTDCAAIGPFTANGTTATDVCLIGGPACIDGTGVTNAACAPLANTAYCLPHDVCSFHCAMPPPLGGPLGSCLSASSTLGFPRIDCTIYATDPGAPCNGANTSTTIDLAALFAGSQKTCGGIQWAPDSLSPYMPVDTLTIPGASAQFQTSIAGDPCSLQIEWNGGTLDAFAQTMVWVLADVKVTDTQHLVLPVSFTRGSCPPPGTDSIVCTTTFTNTSTMDSITSCAK